jgi:PXA domain
VLLPTEDLENDCLTSLVSQILSETILGNGVGGKACEPWLVWEGITNIARAVQAQLPKSRAQVRVDKSLENTSLVTPHAAAAMKVNSSRRFLQKTFWLVLQYAFLAFTTVRFVIVTIASSSSMPSRLLLPSSKLQGTSPVTEFLQPPAWTSTISPRSQRSPLKQPILSMKIWGCAADLLDLDVRMPWLGATISMLQWFALRGPGGMGAIDGIIDKYGFSISSNLISCIHSLQFCDFPISGRIHFQSLDFVFSHSAFRKALVSQLVCAHPYHAPFLQDMGPLCSRHA